MNLCQLDRHEATGLAPWCVTLRSSAAPLFFPSYQGCVDGVFISNNPSLCAAVQTQDARNKMENPRLDEVCVLSIGTKEVFSICGNRHDWGFVKWAFPLLDIMLTKDEGVVNYQCDKLLGDRYKRIELEVPDHMVVKIDNYKIVPKFIEFGNNYKIKPCLDEWVDKYWI